MVKQVIKRVLSAFNLDSTDIKKRFKGLLRLNILRNVNHTHYNKHALLSYIYGPFKVKDNSSRHQNYWQAVEIARIIGSFGYDVDVIDYHDPYVRLNRNRKYDLIFAQYPKSVDRYSHMLKANAVKIAYLTTSSPRFNNASEAERIQDVFKRKGVHLVTWRDLPPLTDDLKEYDAVISFGNDYIMHTYDYFKLPPVYPICNTGLSYTFHRDVSHKDPLNFMYIGGFGQVHKGLDLILDIFSSDGFPCILYVCGNYEYEQDFYELYFDSLYNRKNIIPCGHIDITSKEFIDIANSCAYMLLPSCAESHSGSVAVAMDAGLIPIISKECGYDDEEQVINMPNCNIDTIREYVLSYSKKDKTWIKNASDKCLSVANSRYSRDAFTYAVSHAIAEIIRNKEGQPENEDCSY